MRQSWPDLPEVGIWHWPFGRALTIRIEGSEPGPAADAGAIDAEWARLCADNPRLFDGPILSVTGFEPGRGFRVRRDSYKRFAVQPAVECGVDQLSVTAVALFDDEYGEDRVLLGRRSRKTRFYGGMWELGPSGGVDPPEPGRATLCEGDLVEQLQREWAEETGLPKNLKVLHAAAICRDLRARSYDIVFACRADESRPLGGEDPGPDRWEYGKIMSRPVSRIASIDAKHPDRFISPTRALFRFFGWCQS